jgi:hypothetical protein
MAALLLSIFASEPDFPQIEGDLREEFHRHIQMNGRRTARRWYWRETFRNVLVFIKRPRILYAIAVAALIVVGYRPASMIFSGWLSAKMHEMPRVPGLHPLLIFLFRTTAFLAIGAMAGHILRGRERMLVIAFTVFYLLPLPGRSGLGFIFWVLWESPFPLHLRTFGFILFWCPIIAFWIATRWSARRNGQRRSA